MQTTPNPSPALFQGVAITADNQCNQRRKDAELLTKARSSK